MKPHKRKPLISRACKGNKNKLTFISFVLLRRNKREEMKNSRNKMINHRGKHGDLKINFISLTREMFLYSTHQTIRYIPLFSVCSYGATCLRKTFISFLSLEIDFLFFRLPGGKSIYKFDTHEKCIQCLPKVSEHPREPYGKMSFSRRSHKSSFRRKATNFCVELGENGVNMDTSHIGQGP